MELKNAKMAVLTHRLTRNETHMQIQRPNVFWLSTVFFFAYFAVATGLAGLLHAEKPNVIVIYSDDQGYGDASCLNPDSKFKTPNLDRLAKEGITFTDAHCSDTVCTPSRYGLLTGRYCWRTTRKTGVMGAEGPCLIADGRMTLATLMRANGYRTAMVGKWHLGMDFPGDPGGRDWTQPVQDMPLDKGFDYFYGIPASMNYGVLAWFEGRFAKVPPTLYTAKKKNKIAISDYRIMPPYQNSPEETQKVLGLKGMETAPDFIDSECLTRFTDKAIEWIGNNADAAKNGKPFFLYLPYTSPHKPVIPLPEFRGQGAAGAYGEFMIETDHHVGRILQFLDQSGLSENTLIVYTSDNGPETTWKERAKRFGHQSNGRYREGKRSIYEGGHRVPFFVRWPAGIVEPGRHFDGPICQTDLLATFAELMDGQLPANAGEDSVSFLEAFKNAATLPSQPRPAIVHHAANGRFAIRSGNYKLVMSHGKRDNELYDLSDNPEESADQILDLPEVEKRLTQEITNIICQGRTTSGPPQANDTGYWQDLTWMTEAEYKANGDLGRQ